MLGGNLCVYFHKEVRGHSQNIWPLDVIEIQCFDQGHFSGKMLVSRAVLLNI